jgi:hypothetical protein
MKIKHITLILAAIALISFAGCKDNNNPVGTDDTSSSKIAINDAVQIDGNVATTQLVECTLDNDAFIPGDQTVFENSRMDLKDNGKKCPPKGPLGLGKVMRELNLTTEQIASLEEFNIAHRDCIETAMKAWRDAVAPIIEKANADKKLIMTDLKNKVITRKEAVAKLVALNKQMRTDIEALGMRATTKTAIDDCNKAFLASIKGMLTADQLVIWLKYFPA